MAEGAVQRRDRSAAVHQREGGEQARGESIFGKLDLVPSDDDNRRVLAVLAYLDSSTTEANP